MVLAMSVHSRKTKVSLKKVENYTTKDRLDRLILAIRAIKYCLENQYSEVENEVRSLQSVQRHAA